MPRVTVKMAKAMPGTNLRHRSMETSLRPAGMLGCERGTPSAGYALGRRPVNTPAWSSTLAPAGWWGWWGAARRPTSTPDRTSGGAGPARDRGGLARRAGLPRIGPALAELGARQRGGAVGGVPAQDEHRGSGHDASVVATRFIERPHVRPAVRP